MKVNDFGILEERIKNAESCLFLTSAGMSADSGIPTFRDKEGYWRNFPVFKRLGLNAIDLANPYSFEVRPQYAWAFYEWRRRNAHQNKPHLGYHIINRLIKEVFKKSFVHTTNTDGYHIISGLEESLVYEVHGSMWRLQCMRGYSCEYKVKENRDVPLCDLDYETMIASNLPKCPHCGELLRPNILMFGDWGYVENEYQIRNYNTFVDDVGVPDLIFLIGSSSAVPTNDYLAIRFQSKGSFVITINPDLSSTAVCKPDLFIQKKAKESFEIIQRMIFG
ncbi:SIR2 family NAD-dependent protein deacylase [Hippea maritima]|uniref:protein acetyllysine N-acetyltransferase n=1 Tax=Hippea maritima (strain ATCC 700847 / DSM 10411 / MH2) TaxID=760142 RepID=F2LXZ5_HIPMA|nr:Sir2 family NAD-dependent protein deacetylase [Hippea maritima]AEA33260.1 Silent information regulator protein Sir2 [Hippea maritima DSM 10411]